eukprot:tig00020601_g11730.t1
MAALRDKCSGAGAKSYKVDGSSTCSALRLDSEVAVVAEEEEEEAAEAADWDLASDSDDGLLEARNTRPPRCLDDSCGAELEKDVCVSDKLVCYSYSTATCGGTATATTLKSLNV